MTKLCKLSEEMVVQFLSRLPPKSLIRFKCIRKSWYNLISSPTFMAKNLSISIHNKFVSSTCILFKRTVLKDNEIKDKNEIRAIMMDVNNNNKDILISLLNLYNDYDDDYNNLHSVCQDLNVPDPINTCPYSLEIAGHSNGIICLKDNTDGVVLLCNPAIKEFKFLPNSCLLLPPPDLDDEDALESRTNAVGFGYDSKAKECKVVRIVEFYSGTCIKHPSRAEVYTLGANSWREIKTDTESCVYWSPSSHMYFEGTYYWWALNFTSAEKEVILSFDMGNELFHDIPVPDNFYETRGCYRSLAVWKESVVLLSYQGDSSKSLDMWVMGDFSCVKSSWTKQLSIGSIEDIEIPLVFWKSDELLMVTNDGCVVSYNLDSQTFKYLSIYGLEDPKYIQAIIYHSSIVSVNESTLLWNILAKAV